MVDFWSLFEIEEQVLLDQDPSFRPIELDDDVDDRREELSGPQSAMIGTKVLLFLMLASLKAPRRLWKNDL